MFLSNTFRLAAFIIALNTLTSCAGTSSTTARSGPQQTVQQTLQQTDEASEADDGGNLLDGAFLSYADNDGTTTAEFAGRRRTTLLGGEHHRVAVDVVVREIGDGQGMISWFEADGSHGVQVVDFEQKRLWTATPAEGLQSTIATATITSMGKVDGGELVALKSTVDDTERAALDPAWNDPTYFRGRWLEYTYGNGKFFRNEFHDDVRYSDVKRGLLKEPVVVRPIGNGKLFVSWVDVRLGHIAQVVDLSRGAIWAAVPIGPRTEIWRGQLQGSGEMPPQASTDDPHVDD